MSKRSKRILDLVNSNEQDPVYQIMEETTSDCGDYSIPTEPDRDSSPIRVHSDEELTQCLQDIMHDNNVFSDKNEPINTSIPEESIPEKSIPERSKPEEPVVSITEETEAISKSASPSIDNSTPIPSPVPVHEDPCGNNFCAICLEAYAIRPDEVYLNLPTPSTITGTSTNVTPTTQKVAKKKTYKTDIGKKRLVHKELWCVVQRKKLKNEGKSYINKKGKQIEEKVLGQPCGKKCRYKCTENYDVKQREAIFSKFWNLGDRNRQWEFVIKYTKKINKGRKTTEIVKHKREYTYVYYLPTTEKETKRVCKQMFLSTISSGERIITTAWKKYDGIAAVEKDKRGMYDHKPRVIDEVMVQSVKDHVNCLDRVDSHYTRKDSKKLYLNNIKSTSQMHKLYVEWYDPNIYNNQANKRQYRDIVNVNFNLAFHKPKKDLCEVCHIFENNQFPTDEEKQRFFEHQAQKKKARSLKQADKTEACENPEIVVATFDFQKVLQAPHGEVSIFYYKRKLNTFNFTVFELGNKTATCYMWHEGIAKRGANEVSSCLYDFIKVNAEKGVHEFRFWSDNCAGQNRNRIVFALYLLAAKEFGVTVTHRFMEKGHTQNEGDSVHALVERESERRMIYVPDEWFCLVRWAKTEGMPYNVREMTSRDFYNFKD
ncbi:uncharacterized protein LOC124641446 [Helicoverpa zea]|uniref:uncharacterized protein LOC124641446 n=2 Tax=Helicoverpa zea TaxID=7113 RepID=UPI001F5846A7|nr:uncharacterized protein LOC124641446 [Helicoverpa zea]